MNLEKIKILGKEFLCLVPYTQLEKEEGLINTRFLPSNHGMLFKDIETPAFFHTVGMKFPIDMVCFDEDDNIIDIIKNVKPGKKEIKLDNRTKTMIELNIGQLDADNENKIDSFTKKL